MGVPQFVVIRAEFAYKNTKLFELFRIFFIQNIEEKHYKFFLDIILTDHY